jgi:hypothetical protein
VGSAAGKVTTHEFMFGSDFQAAESPAAAYDPFCYGCAVYFWWAGIMNRADRVVESYVLREAIHAARACIGTRSPLQPTTKKTFYIKHVLKISCHNKSVIAGLLCVKSKWRARQGIERTWFIKLDPNLLLLLPLSPCTYPVYKDIYGTFLLLTAHFSQGRLVTRATTEGSHTKRERDRPR